MNSSYDSLDSNLGFDLVELLVRGCIGGILLLWG